LRGSGVTAPRRGGGRRMGGVVSAGRRRMQSVRQGDGERPPAAGRARRLGRRARLPEDAFHGLESQYRLIFYDQRGSLRSPCPSSLVSVEQHIADLEALRAELAIDAPVIIGHSMGTFLAMSYLERHPHRVGGLVLLGSYVPAPPRDEEELAI